MREPTERLLSKLDANENWHVPPERIRALFEASLKEVDTREYPEGAVGELGENISRLLGIPAGCVVPCAGADQAIDLLCQAFLGSGDRAIIVSPTFSMYRLRATIAGAECVNVPMSSDFGLPKEEMIRSAGKRGVLFVCSPNNPTGNQFPEEEVTSLLESFPGLVVLDEAYVEFADFSLSRRVAEFRNLAVLRTFSKAYGMAGLRLGYFLANEEWAPEFLARVQYPYPISSVAAVMAIALLRRRREVDAWIRAVKRERVWLAGKLRAIRGTRVVDSKANFLMASLPVDSTIAHRKLLARGIATRDLGRIMHLPNCLRITVGTRPMNSLLLEGLAEAANVSG